MNFAAVGNSGGGDAAAVCGDLRELPQALLPDPAAVRAEIRALRNAGLGPDLRPPLLHRLAGVLAVGLFR